MSGERNANEFLRSLQDAPNSRKLRFSALRLPGGLEDNKLMTLLTRIHNGTIEIPSDVLRHLHIVDDATLLIEINPVNCSMVLRKIDREQAWFWTPEWQAGERQANNDLTEGNFTRFFTDKDFLDSLE